MIMEFYYNFQILIKSIILLILVNTTIGQSMKFTRHPQISVDDTLFEFDCEVESNDPVTIKWIDYRTNTTLQASSMNHLKQTRTGKLTRSDLNIVHTEKGYTYQVYCEANNGIETIISETASGGAPFIDPILKSNKEITKTAYIGDSLSLYCHVTKAFPKPKVQWIKDGRQLLIRPYEDPHLTIDVVSYGDQGIYKCTLENMVGSVENAPIRVIVELIPDYEVMEKVKVGERANLTCTNNSGPRKWRKIDGNVDPKRSEISENNLILNEVQSSDHGIYICEDFTGKTISQISLVVLSDPEFYVTPENQKVPMGSVVVFQCRAKGFPQPNIHWSLPDKSLIFPNNPIHEKYEVLPEGHLRIKNVNLEDEGEYQCSASSPLNVRITKAFLKVIPRNPDRQDLDYGHESGKLSPIIKLPPSSISITRGHNALFPCQLNYLEDNYRYKISWTKKTRSAGDIIVIISSDQRFNINHNGSLLIKDVRYEDMGTYTCFVEVIDNMALKSKWSAILDVVDIPSRQIMPDELPNAPTHLSYQLENRNIILSWKPPTNILPNNILYRIEYFNKNEPETGWQLAEENWSTTDIKVQQLIPENAYYFLIRPKIKGNDLYGWSSQTIGPIILKKNVNVDGHDLITTIQSIQLREIESTNIGQNNLRLKWKVDDHLLPYIGGFNMKYREVPLIRCISEIFHQQSMLKRSLSLEYCSLYNLEKEFKGSNQNIKFIDYQEKVLKQFDLPANMGESNTQKVEVSGQSSIFEIILSNMRPFSCQEFEIEPFSVASPTYGSIKGRESPSHTILVSESRPTVPPQGLCVNWINETALSISWEMLDYQSWNGLPVAYAIYLTDKSSKKVKLIKTDTTKNSIILSSVTELGPFTINIAAENCIDSSIRSENVDFHRITEEDDASTRWGCRGENSDISNKRFLTDYLIRIITIVSGIVLLFVTILICTSFLCCFRRKLDKKDLVSNLYTGQPSYEVSLKAETKGNFHLEPLLNTPLQQHQRGPLPPSYTTSPGPNTSQMICTNSSLHGTNYMNNNHIITNNSVNNPQQGPCYSTYNPMLACNHHTQNYPQVEDYGAPYASTVVVPECIELSNSTQPYQNQYICHSSSSATGEESLTKGYNNSKKTNSTRTPSSTTSSNGISTQRQPKQCQNNSRHFFEHMIPPPPSSPPPPCPPSSNPNNNIFNQQNSNYSDLF